MDDIEQKFLELIERLVTATETIAVALTEMAAPPIDLPPEAEVEPEEAEVRIEKVVAPAVEPPIEPEPPAVPAVEDYIKPPAPVAVEDRRGHAEVRITTLQELGKAIADKERDNETDNIA